MGRQAEGLAVVSGHVPHRSAANCPVPAATTRERVKFLLIPGNKTRTTGNATLAVSKLRRLDSVRSRVSFSCTLPIG